MHRAFPDGLGQIDEGNIDLPNLTFDLLLALQICPAARVGGMDDPKTQSRKTS